MASLLLLSLLPNVGYSTIDVVQKGLCRTEEFGHTSGKIVGTNERIGGCME